jgi:hypothetical protein
MPAGIYFSIMPDRDIITNMDSVSIVQRTISVYYGMVTNLKSVITPQVNI